MMLKGYLHLAIIVCCCLLLVQAKKKKEKGSSKSDSLECYDDIDKPYIYFASKTAYHFNKNKNDDEIQHEGCKAVQFWILARHGTRNPGTKDMTEMRDQLPLKAKEILNNHKEKRGTLCEDDLENLEDWKFIANVTEDKFLVKEGYEELKDLGDRYQERFPALLSRPFVNESYIFQYTDSERTDASASAFARGVFGRTDAANVYYRKSPKRDVLLRFYKSCDKWKKEVDDNPDAIIEKKKYENTEEFKLMMKTVSDRLGYTSSLQIHDIDLMYNMCAFDKAWRPKKLSPWCAAFSQSDLEIMEYREDLEYYYEDGYGFPINYVQACPPVQDVYEHFRKVVEEVPSRPKGMFYFTHSGTILKTFARFGLFEDAIRPTHSNRLEVTKREWRTSLIDSFASNLALVLFNCSGSYRVGSYVQERPVKLPGCSDKLCPFSEFTAKYGPISEKCNLDQICTI